MEDEPVEIPIEDALDLHPFQAAEIRSVTREYLTEARNRGLRQVRLIHGRGIGVQRANVQTVLREIDFVDHFWDEAHLGATVVVLKLSG